MADILGYTTEEMLGAASASSSSIPKRRERARPEFEEQTREASFYKILTA